jgi:hypothetical protein
MMSAPPIPLLRVRRGDGRDQRIWDVRDISNAKIHKANVKRASEKAWFYRTRY